MKASANSTNYDYSHVLLSFNLILISYAVKIGQALDFIPITGKMKKNHTETTKAR